MKNGEKLTQDETSSLIDQYWIDSHTYAAHGDPIRIERFVDDDAECHSCGKVGRPRNLIHLAHLCQHFVALCDVCWKKFKAVVAQKAD